MDAVFKDEVDFPDTTPEFKNIKLKLINPNSGQYHIFVTKNIFSTSHDALELIFAEATLEAQNFVYIFSAAADIKIFDFECKGYFKGSKFVKINEIFEDYYRVTISTRALLTVDKHILKNIKKRMKEGYDLSSLHMFYDSANVKEPIGRFISLYTLLLHIYSDKQGKVDRAILKIDSSVCQFRYPHKPGFETIFTRLRNELSHKRKGVNILKTHIEIKANIDRFEQIVKKLIIKKP